MRGVFLKNGLVHRFSKISQSAGSKISVPVLKAPATGRSLHHHNLSNKTRELESSSWVFAVPFSSASSRFSKSGFVKWYLEMLDSRPLLTKSITSSIIYTLADMTSQKLPLIIPKLSGENSHETSESLVEIPYDFMRTLRMAGYGLLILGPSLHHWFNFVSKLLPNRDIITTLKKMALGQLTYGPVMTVVFFSTNAALQGENVSEIVARLERDLFPTMINGIMYWPACDFITFKLIPVHLQPLASNSFSYVWTVYLTYMASLQKPETKP